MIKRHSHKAVPLLYYYPLLCRVIGSPERVLPLNVRIDAGNVDGGDAFAACCVAEKQCVTLESSCALYVSVSTGNVHSGELTVHGYIADGADLSVLNSAAADCDSIVAGYV